MKSHSNRLWFALLSTSLILNRAIPCEELCQSSVARWRTSQTPQICDHDYVYVNSYLPSGQIEHVLVPARPPAATKPVGVGGVMTSRAHMRGYPAFGPYYLISQVPYGGSGVKPNGGLIRRTSYVRDPGSSSCPA